MSEALKKARDALAGILNGCEYSTIYGTAHWHQKTMPTNDALTSSREAIAAIDAALAQQVQPVAWRVRRHDAPAYWIIFLHKPVDAMQDPEREVQPLYVAPQLAPLPAVDGWVNINGTDYHESVVRAVERAHGIEGEA